MTPLTAPNEHIADGMSAAERAVKRAFDLTAAAVGLIVLSPAFLVIIALMKFLDHGSVIYRQERIGYKGKPFYIMKFRTMIKDCEDDGVPKLFTENADNVTPIGHFLRDHHLDELPQLINILVGDMSLVGPRPERKYFIDQIMEHDPRYEELYQVRPGATSMATIYNGYTDTMEKMLIRLRMDLDYVEHRSLWLDIKIMVLTAKRIVLGKKF